MSILSVSEFQSFFPGNTSSDDEILLSIQLASQAIKSPLGANRSLEIISYQQHKSLRRFESSVLLSFFPVVEVTEVALRGNIINYFDRNTLGLDWNVIPPETYELQSNNQLLVKFLTRQVWNPLRTSPLDIRISYSAGYDFNNLSDDSVHTIKLLTANCVNFSLSDPRFSGTQSFSVDGEFSISFPSPNVANSSFSPAQASGSFLGFPSQYLQSFFSYRPYFR